MLKKITGHDLSGRRFGRLRAVSIAVPTGKRRQWECVCDCGNLTNVDVSKLLNGHTQSCGCLQRERTAAAKTTHGLRRKYPSEYGVWLSMRNRCALESVKCFDRYGGRGITVCERWHDFANFLNDMGPRPGPEYSVDRVDNDAGYGPENCKWATRYEQGRNKRNNRLITLDGITKTLSDWCRDLSLSRKTITSRLSRGWDGALALTTPIRSIKC